MCCGRGQGSRRRCAVAAPSASPGRCACRLVRPRASTAREAPPPTPLRGHPSGPRPRLRADDREHVRRLRCGRAQRSARIRSHARAHHGAPRLPTGAAELSARIRSMDFATAASRLLAAHAGWRDRDLVATPRGLRAEAISLALRAYRVTLVRTLCTRLQLTSSGEDVTADAPSDDGSGAGSGAAGAASTSATSSAHNSAAAHDDAWYVDRKGSELLLLATAPAGLSREQLLAQAVCEVLGVDAPTSLAPLLAVDASQAAATLARLRVPPPPHWATACMRSPRRLHSSQVPPPPQWAAASAVGSAGTPCTTEDEALLQLRPLRAYFAGEVVCISASQLGISAGGDEADGYVYAEVDVATACMRSPRRLHSPQVRVCRGGRGRTRRDGATSRRARRRRLLRQWRRRTLSHATWHATWHAIWPDGGPPGRWPARAYAVPLSTSALVPLDTARARRGERYDCRWRCRGRSRSRRRRRDAGRDAGFVNGCATRCADRRPLLR